MRKSLAITLVSIALLLGIFGSIALSSPKQPGKVVFIPPPRPSDRGTPTARNQAGSRGCPMEEKIAPGEPIALGGTPGYTLTLEANPTLWFFIPYRNSVTVEFEVQYNDTAKPDRRAEVFEKIPVSLPDRPALIPVRISKSLPAGRAFRWYLAIACSSGQGEIFLTGEVTRISPTDDLTRQLATARTDLEKEEIYARNGIWYDALTGLARIYSERSDLLDIWRDFLASSGLEAIDRIPIRSNR